jgi:PASTA domain
MRASGPLAVVAAGLSVAAMTVAAPVFAADSPSAIAVDSGTLSVCNTSGSPPITIALTYSLNAPASAGGSQVLSASPGTCTVNIWYPVGTNVTVLETVPTGFTVTSITIGGGESTLAQTVPSAGMATVTIGNGNSVLTFTTKAPGAPPAAGCVVPRVVGLTLAAARKAVVHALCRVGSVHYIYSSRIPKGGVTSVSPKPGAHLAHNAKLRLNVSRGRKS